MPDDLAMLQETIEALEERLRHVQQGPDNDAAADQLDALAATVADLGQQVQDGAAAALEWGERSLGQLAAWHAAAMAEVDETVQAVEQLIEGTDTFADALRDEAGQLGDACEEAGAEVADAVADFAGALDAAAQAVLLGPLSEAFDRRIADVDDAQHQAIDAGAQQLEAAAVELLALLLAALADARETLSAAITQSQGDRAATQPLLDAVQAVLDPLLEQVERVTGLAGAVGVSI